MKKVTEFECGNCGTKYGVYMENGKTVVTDGNKVVNKVEGIPSKASAKLEALKKAGVDVSGFFAMGNADGDGLLYRIIDNVPTAIPEDDPIFLKIIEEGRAYDPRLAPRWVMSQMFHILRSLERQKDPSSWAYKICKDHTFNDYVQYNGLEWAIKFLDEEFARQTNLAKKKDWEVFGTRSLFWNKDVAVALAEDVLAKTIKHIDSLKTKKCKGVPYKRISGFGDVFVTDLEKRVYMPMRAAITAIKKATTTERLSLAWNCFRKCHIRLNYDAKICPEFFDAYKGFGALATMQNMIHYHGCVITDEYGVKLNKTQSLIVLMSKARQYAAVDCSGKTQGWRLFGMMKKLIEDNGISVERKIQEWSDAKK